MTQVGIPDRYQPSESFDEAMGIKTIIEYRRDEKTQQLINVTRQVKVTKRIVRINKRVEQRRAEWGGFGDCTTPNAGATCSTGEVINLDVSVKKTRSDGDRNENDLERKLALSVVICQHCGEAGHWTVKCPKRSAITVPKGAVTQAPAANRYVPVHLRATSNISRETDEVPSVRVSNLSEDTSEADIRELFGRFGRITRVYLVRDRERNNVSRGFAFVTFATKAEGQDAITRLNGHGYDNLIG